MLIVWWMAGLLDADIPDAGITTPDTLGTGDPPLRRSSRATGRILPTKHWAAVQSATLIRSAIISPCAGAIDSRGESKLLMSTSPASREKKSGVPATTLPYSLCASHSSIEPGPVGFFGISPSSYSFPSGHALCFYGALAAILSACARGRAAQFCIWIAATLWINDWIFAHLSGSPLP